MKNPFKWLLGVVLRTKKHSELSETIKGKIDEFLDNFFPRKSDIVLRKEQIPEAVSKYEDIKKLVLSVTCFGHFERYNVEHILANLSSYYFNPFKGIRKDTSISTKDVSEIINGLKIVRHILIHRLERKHKDVSHALEGIRLQTQHILENYFHESLGNQIAGIRMIDLNKEFKILQKKVKHFDKVTKKAPSEYRKKLTQINELLNALYELIFRWVEQRGTYYVFSDKKQIVTKLNLLIDTTTL